MATFYFDTRAKSISQLAAFDAGVLFYTSKQSQCSGLALFLSCTYLLLSCFCFTVITCGYFTVIQKSHFLN